MGAGLNVVYGKLDQQLKANNTPQAPTIEFDDAESVELRVGDGMPMGQLVQVVSGRTAAVPPESLAFLGQGPTDAADRYVFPIRQVRPTGCEVSLGGQSWTTEFGEHGWSRDGSEDRKAFEVMDANKDGVVTREELTTLLKGLGENVTDDVVDEMIKIADENNDGKIQFEEFVKAATEGNM